MPNSLFLDIEGGNSPSIISLQKKVEEMPKTIPTIAIDEGRGFPLYLNLEDFDPKIHKKWVFQKEEKKDEPETVSPPIELKRRGRPKAG